MPGQLPRVPENREATPEPTISGAEPTPSPPPLGQETGFRLDPVGGSRALHKPPQWCKDEIVQFMSTLHLVPETAGTARVELMRIGRAHKKCSVELFTIEGSARAGEKFTPVNQLIEFAAGEVLKAVLVPVLYDSNFNTTLEFECGLRSAKGCVIGHYLSVCRVMIIDTDVFPSDVFRIEIENLVNHDDEETLGKQSFWLLLEFMRFSFSRVPTLWWKSILHCVIDQFHNLYFLVRIWLKVYLVDVVLSADPDSEDKLLVKGNRHLTAVFLAVMWAAPNFALLIADRIKAGPLEISRPLRLHLKVNLFRKYLQFTEASREKVPVQDFKEAMSTDIPMLVEDGYMVAFSLQQALGRVLLVAWYLLAEDKSAALPLLVLPAAMLTFIYGRMASHMQYEKEMMECEAKTEECIVGAVTEYDLVRDYKMRHRLVDRFSALMDNTRAAYNKLKLFDFWDEQLVPWLTLGCICFFMLIGSQLVLSGVQTVGGFVATMEIYQELGDNFSELYDILRRCVAAAYPLIDFTRMLNLPTDVNERMEHVAERRDYTKSRLERQLKLDPHKVICMDEARAPRHRSFFDTIPITLARVSVGHLPSLQNVTMEVQPEEVLYVTGDHGTGKKTLLSLFSDIHFPKQGHVFMPSHCRCLDVSNTPHLLKDLNLYENLVFGTRRPIPERVRRIFCRLRLDREQGLLGLLDSQIGRAAPARQETMSREDEERCLLAVTPRPSEMPGGSREEVAAWYTQLSFSERKHMNLARALICNPEVLVVHKPIDVLDTKDVKLILDLFLEYVENRGVELAHRDRLYRRPRTLIFSGGLNQNARWNALIADGVWTLTTGKGIQASPGGRGKPESAELLGALSDPSALMAPANSPPGSEPRTSPRGSEPRSEVAPSPPPISPRPGCSILGSPRRSPDIGPNGRPPATMTIVKELSSPASAGVSPITGMSPIAGLSPISGSRAPSSGAPSSAGSSSDLRQNNAYVPMRAQVETAHTRRSV